VSLQRRGSEWHLAAVGRRRGELKLWQSYSREEIPPLFGLEFSTAIWNAGFVKRPGHIFLLVTLDKSGHAEDFKYHDRFIDRTVFEWQSQNRTSRDSADGRAIRNHESQDIAVHLFVRSACGPREDSESASAGARRVGVGPHEQKRKKKTPAGGSAPFVYCGDVRFQSWEKEKPITVRWGLAGQVPENVWRTLQPVD
jgi:Domain of unknown function (DUF3427)